MLTIKCLGQDLGGTGLTGAPGTGKQLCMTNAARGNRITECAADMFLPDKILEAARAPLPI